MASIEIINASQKKVGDITLDDAVLEEKVNKAVLFQAIKRHLAGKHHGTVRTQTRADVSRTGKKLYRQKGSGNARHGSKKAPPYVGAGRAHGPKPRSYTESFPKKMKKLAIKEAIRGKIKDGELMIVDSIPLTSIKTKDAYKFLQGLNITRALIVLTEKNVSIEKSIQNIPGCDVALVEHMNAYDLIKYPKILFVQDAFEKAKERYLN